MRVTQLILSATLALALPLGFACKDKGGDGDGTTDGGSISDGGGTTDGGGTADGGSAGTDADHDGVTVEDGDCNDDDPTIHPGLEEICDEVDQNCNGINNEGFDDTDGDTIADCIDSEDCDGLDNDGDGLIDEDFPDDNGNGIPDCAEEEICDGIDNDGDGDTDEGFDLDGDGYTSCGDAETRPDCNDDDPEIHPDADETSGDLVDNDCDGLIDEGSWRRGDLYITEVMSNPRNVIDTDGEWFEIYNAAGRDLVLNGMVIMSTTDSDYHVVESDRLLMLSPGDHFIFGVSDDIYANGGVDVDYVYHGSGSTSDVDLENESDDLVLMMADRIIDELAWDDGATMPDAQGASMTLDPTYYGDTMNDDGDHWCAAQEEWAPLSDLGSPGVENESCWPIAQANYDSVASSLLTCDMLYLVGSGSYDPDGADITYEWELVSAPDGSDATSDDIVETDDADPYITIYTPGEYIFSLTVYNGTEYSSPDFLTVTIGERPYNDDPVAVPGDDLTYSADAVCYPLSYGVSYTCRACDDLEFELDGTDSWDPDDDDIIAYSWEITGGTATASIEDEDTSTPVVTMSSATPDYGSSATSTVELTLTVTDCMGATGSDQVVITYECSGT